MQTAPDVNIVFDLRTVGILRARSKDEQYELIRLGYKPGGPYLGGWDLVRSLKANKIIGHLICDLTMCQMSMAIEAALFKSTRRQ